MLGLGLASARPSAAEPTAAESARLETLLREGDAAAKAKKWQACIEARSAAFLIEDAANIAGDLGLCEEQAGRISDAMNHVLRALAEATPATKAQEPWKSYQAAAHRGRERAQAHRSSASLDSSRYRRIREVLPRLFAMLTALAVLLEALPGYAGTGAPARAVRTRVPDPRPAPIGGVSASLFKFKTTINDDGTDVGGGWQVADTTLNFVDARNFLFPSMWTCTLNIGMPLRTAKKGKISAEKAAAVATKASLGVMHTKDRWVPAEFCNAWRAKMKKISRRRSPTRGSGRRLRHEAHSRRSVQRGIPLLPAGPRVRLHRVKGHAGIPLPAGYS